MNGYNGRTLSPERLISLSGSLFMQDQTRGFPEKRQFRAYKEFSVLTVIKMVFAKPFYLTAQSLWTGQGAARLVISTGGVEGGTFVTMPTKFCKWLLDGPVAGNTLVTTGGTVTIVNEREVLRSDSGTAGGGAGNGTELANKRALPAGTYYFTITPTGTTSGMYSLEWEEFV
jgi:hypothetical protein